MRFGPLVPVGIALVASVVAAMQAYGVRNEAPLIDRVDHPHVFESLELLTRQVGHPPIQTLRIVNGMSAWVSDSDRSELLVGFPLLCAPSQAVEFELRRALVRSKFRDLLTRVVVRPTIRFGSRLESSVKASQSGGLALTTNLTDEKVRAAQLWLSLAFALILMPFILLGRLCNLITVGDQARLADESVSRAESASPVGARDEHRHLSQLFSANVVRLRGELLTPITHIAPVLLEIFNHGQCKDAAETQQASDAAGGVGNNHVVIDEPWLSNVVGLSEASWMNIVRVGLADAMRLPSPTWIERAD